MSAYYNEFDKQKAAWLRELIKRNLIAPGYVDERSIKDVQPGDLHGYTQCHFFAGVGAWSYALRQAGWSDDREVWTGSCPCQSFSVAGQKKGFADERHLWPEWYRLIAQRTPSVIFGEQSASKDALAWLDLVQTNLEDSRYAFAPADICAAGFGAPHIRQRLYFVAEALDNSSSTRCVGPVEESEGIARNEARLRLFGEGSGSCGLALTDSERRGRREGAAPGSEHDWQDAGWQQGKHGSVGSDEARASELADAHSERRKHESYIGTASLLATSPGTEEQRYEPSDYQSSYASNGFPGPVNGFWSDADWLRCTDGKWRSVEPGTFPLADGAPARVGRLRGYGDAIVAEVAKEFITAYRAIAG